MHNVANIQESIVRYADIVWNDAIRKDEETMMVAIEVHYLLWIAGLLLR